MASKIGDEAALKIYIFLLKHTVSITQNLNVQKRLYYSEEVWDTDIWGNTIYQKKLQKGGDLGLRMLDAFQDGFKSGYEKIIIIGSDMYDLSQRDLETAFLKLDNHDYVLGPAEDGGYYLLGMTSLKEELFQDKLWGTEAVLPSTLDNLKGENLFELPLKNDIDHYEDIKEIKAFSPYLKHIKE